MPRPKRPNGPEPKRRSRKGCWPCKARKVKCGEEKPSCLNCQRQGDVCDYSIRLNWEGRTKRKTSIDSHGSQSSAHASVFSFRVPLTQSTLFTAATVPRGAVPRYNSSLQSSDDVSYPSPADTSSSLGSLAGFSFATTSVLQHPLEATSHPLDSSSPDCEGLLDCYSKHARIHPNGFDWQSQDGASPQTADFGFPNHVSSSATNSNDFFSKVINKPLVPNRRPINHFCGPVSPAHTNESRGFNAKSHAAADLSSAESKWHAYLTTVTDNYGLDRGRPDLDLNKNNDHEAIDINYALDLISSRWWSEDGSDKQEASTLEQSDGIRHAYYASPVPIDIPRYLSPLPSSLLQNPINLMYFHHFLNHTARKLVPHDCGDNPFISVMPSMAIVDPNLLNLMLAYSASHRARCLDHPEPATRIAHWVSDVFPTLRLALEGPHENITDSHLATAVMLLSLKVISPSTFEVPVPWQSHLKLARDLFLAREGQQIAHHDNRIGIFLSRWLAYLDILGSLSCRHAEPPLIEINYRSLLNASAAYGQDAFRVDCFTGFTPRTGLFLMRLGALTNRCDNERFDEMGVFRLDWTPSSDILVDAEALLGEIGYIREHAHARGSHYQEADSRDILAIEDAFLISGMIHLHRRVLGSASHLRAVKELLNGLIDALNRMQRGGSAEVGALFPLFTAGCESQDAQQRLEIMERIKSLEGTGMKQIQNARKLMQRCWDEDLPWIALAQGEFLG